MGNYLNAPIKEKASLDGEYEGLYFGASDMQGWRTTMEDAKVLELSLDGTSLFCVFDGHGGKEVAQFSAEHFPEELRQNDNFRNKKFEEALTDTFFRLDDMLRDSQYADEIKGYRGNEGFEKNEDSEANDGETITGTSEGATAEVEEQEEVENAIRDQVEQTVKERLEQAETKGFLGKTEAIELVRQMLKLKKLDTQQGVSVSTEAGCTAIVALKVDQTLYVANAGDSRAVICRNGDAIALSEDHKPLNETERTRIETAGGYVTPAGRVNGNLNLSRAIGDLEYKRNTKLDVSSQIITAKPDLVTYSLTEEDQFFILACDGVWEILSNEAIVDFVKQELKDGERKISAIIEKIFERCTSDDPMRTQGLGGDNMTCIIVFLKPVEQVAGELA